MQRIIALITAVFCLISTTGHAQNSHLADVMLGALHQVQENLAYGDPVAAATQAEILARLQLELGKPFSEESSDWDKAAVGFALSGGDAAGSRGLLLKINKQSRFYKVGQAAQFYTSGDMGEAARRFAEIDPQSIAGGLAPYVMLALGTAMIDSDVDAARRSFEKVVLEAPGTLLEEVALRRLLVLGNEHNNKVNFNRAANLYLRRYLASPFAAQFIDSYAVGAVHFLTVDELSEWLKIIVRLPSTNRHALMSTLLMQSAIGGRLDMVRQIASDGSANYLNQGEPVETKFRLYGLIANVKSLESPRAFEAAKRDSIGTLNNNDRLIRDKAFQTLERMFDALTGTGFDANSDKISALQSADRTAQSSEFDVVIGQLIASTGSNGASIDAKAIAQPAFDHWFETRFVNNLRELAQIERDVGLLGK